MRGAGQWVTFLAFRVTLLSLLQKPNIIGVRARRIIANERHLNNKDEHG
jgi:hypothetical protein